MYHLREDYHTLYKTKKPQNKTIYLSSINIANTALIVFDWKL